MKSRMLHRRLLKLQEQAVRRPIRVPARVVIIDPEVLERIKLKERARAHESNLFADRVAPYHCWELTDEQIEVAAQIILDELYSDIQSPYDKKITQEQRKEVEESVRRQMTNSENLSSEPIREYGKLLRVARQANDTGDLTQLTDAELLLLKRLQEHQDLNAPE
jgi:hypothetical protein